MNIPQVFDFNNQSVRVVEKDGEPWFVAKDIADVLGYSNINDAIARHCKGVAKHDLPSTSGIQAFSIIPERDLYRLIMRSKLPTAEKFEEWVVGEVLPTIRKTGSYSQVPQIPQTLPEALRLAADLADKVEAQQKEISAMQPSVDALDRIAKADGSLCLTDAAKALQLSPQILNKSLQAAGWIYRRPGKGSFIAYQNRIKSGDLVHKITTIPLQDGTERISEQVRVTPQGLAKIAKVMKGKVGGEHVA